MPTVIPAYGRDYKSAKKAKSDWDMNKDFVCQSVDIGYGQYIKKSEAEALGPITIRYNSLQKVVVV